MERIIGVNTNCYHGYSLEEALQGIRDAGFRYVELTATKGWTEHVFPSQSFAQLCAARDKMQALGLTPFALSGHTNLMDTARLPDFALNIQLAAFFGCTYIVTSIGEAHLEDKETAGSEGVAANIRTLLPLLEKHGLMLVLELHGDHATGAVMEEIVRLVGSPRVAINYDTANAIFYGGVDPVQDIDTCMADVAFMHVKDKAGAQREWNFPALGQGTVDLPGVFGKLAAARNNCPLSVEIEFTEKGPADLAEVDRAVKDSAAYLRAQGFTL